MLTRVCEREGFGAAGPKSPPAGGDTASNRQKPKPKLRPTRGGLCPTRGGHRQQYGFSGRERVPDRDQGGCYTFPTEWALEATSTDNHRAHAGGH